MATTPRRLRALIPLATAVVLAAPAPSSATHTTVPAPPPCTDTSFLTLEAFGTLKSIICSGQFVTTVDGSFEFQGLPDGIGIAPGPTKKTVNVFVNHEESHVPFPAPPAANAQADFQDSSVSRLTLDRSTGLIVDADIALSAEPGFIRFCSSFMAGPAEGFDDYTLFTNEESDDDLPVPPGAPYGPDPGMPSNTREAGYAVVLDAESGEFTQVAGMGRMNHENTVPIPGDDWEKIALLTTDDTFNAPSSQLYLYLASRERDIWRDRGSLWAFQVTRTGDGKVDPFDPQNGANDYLDIGVGDDWEGRFIRVPEDVAKGQLPGVAPQKGLEDWSNENNVFQFIRLEDLDYDRKREGVVYIADTGATRVVPNPATGRLHRPSGVVGQADNGRIFRFEFDEDSPRKVDSFSVFLNADAPDLGPTPGGPMRQPDNIGISKKSLMVQEDATGPPNSRMWRYDFKSKTWSVVAHVNEADWESSGIVDASKWFGSGAWLLDVQGHGDDDWVASEAFAPGRPWHLKQEAGQLLLMRLPGT